MKKRWRERRIKEMEEEKEDEEQEASKRRKKVLPRWKTCLASVAIVIQGCFSFFAPRLGVLVALVLPLCADALLTKIYAVLTLRWH